MSCMPISVSSYNGNPLLHIKLPTKEIHSFVSDCFDCTFEMNVIIKLVIFNHMKTRVKTY